MAEDLRAGRIYLPGKDLAAYGVTETDLAAILELAGSARAALLVIDSIQTVQAAETAGATGAVSQLRECTAQLVRFAKSSGTAVIIIGHVT